MAVKIVIMVSHHPLPACPVFIFYPFYARKLLYNEASLAFDYLYAFVYLFAFTTVRAYPPQFVAVLRSGLGERASLYADIDIFPFWSQVSGIY